MEHPPDVLPAFVAELDVALAPVVRDALVKAVELGDTGYAEPGGLKWAVVIAGSGAVARQLDRLSEELRYRAGLLGVIAGQAAFEHGDAWLDELLAALDANRRRLGELLERHLPQVAYAPPDASFLAWLDCRALGLGDDPAAAFLERGRVALVSGPTFGAQGRGFARLNIGTSEALLTEAVERMAAAVA